MTGLRIVTLLTDFGDVDAYVGVLKAVLLREAPDVTLVDLSHRVPAYDRLAAAYVLETAVPWFPTTAVHLSSSIPVSVATAPPSLSGPAGERSSRRTTGF